MDMKINKEILRRERELRAWTQSHLAEVANLSMRTVQRIECTGDASMESAGALAAALDVELTILMALPDTVNPPVSTKPKRYTLWGVFGLIGAMLVTLGWWTTAAAEQVMVSLSIERGEQTYSDIMLLNQIGKEEEMELDSQFRMLMNTERQGGQLLFSAKIYHFADGEYHLFSSPTMLVENKQPASMRIIFPDEQRMSLQLVADF